MEVVQNRKEEEDKGNKGGRKSYQKCNVLGFTTNFTRDTFSAYGFPREARRSSVCKHEQTVLECVEVGGESV